MINDIINGNFADAKIAFEQQLQEKIVIKTAEKRVDVAKSYGTVKESVEEDVTNEDSE